VLPGASKPGVTDARVMRQSTAVMGMGFDFLGTIVAFSLLGWGLDALAGISPVGVVSGVVLGVVIGFYRLVRGALAQMK
jgi:F0F1-type ATP synthase assembly protein I